MISDTPPFLSRRILTGIRPWAGPSKPDATSDLPGGLQRAVQYALASEGRRLYALVDGAMVMGLSELLETSDMDWRSLFKGLAAEEMSEVAPYLISLPLHHQLTRALFAIDGVVQPLWNRNAATFLVADKTIDVVCKGNPPEN